MGANLTAHRPAGQTGGRSRRNLTSAVPASRKQSVGYSLPRHVLGIKTRPRSRDGPVRWPVAAGAAGSSGDMGPFTDGLRAIAMPKPCQQKRTIRGWPLPGSSGAPQALTMKEDLRRTSRAYWPACRQIASLYRPLRARHVAGGLDCACPAAASRQGSSRFQPIGKWSVCARTLYW